MDPRSGNKRFLPNPVPNPLPDAAFFNIALAN